MGTSTQGRPSKKSLDTIFDSYWRGIGPIVDPYVLIYEGQPPLSKGSYPLSPVMVYVSWVINGG